MTRDGTVGRFRRNRAKPGCSSGHRSRSNDEDSVRGPHQGQQSTRTAPTGRTHDCKRPLGCTPNDLLPGGVHPHMNTSVAGDFETPRPSYRGGAKKAVIVVAKLLVTGACF